MNIRLHIYYTCCIFLMSVFACAQATIDESQAITTLYVNCSHPTASDAYSGTNPSYPLLTVSAAVERARTYINTYKAGTRIWVFPGMYREAWPQQAGLQFTTPNAPLIIEGTNGVADEIVLSGSIVFTNGWNIYSGSVYSNYWQYNWGVQTQQAQYGNVGLSARREMLIVNGVLYEQKTILADLRQGTFCVDEDADRIYMYPPTDIELTNVLIETAVVPRLVRFQQSTNIVLRNITVQHYNLPIWYDYYSGMPDYYYAGWGRALLFNSCVNVLVDGCRIVWNNSGGLSFGKLNTGHPSAFLTVTNCHLDYNGQAGFGGGEITDVLMIDSTADYNNWRGALGSYYGWSSGGFRINLLHRARLHGLQTYHNLCPGIWLDSDIKNVVVEDADAQNNLSTGIFIEKTPGPCVLSNSTFIANYKGIKGADSENVWIEKNLSWCNGEGQIAFDKNFDPGYPYTDFETGISGTSRLQNWSVTTNTFIGNNEAQILFRQSGFDWTKSLWNTHVSSLVSASNSWWNGENTSVFDIKDCVRTDFAGWQAETGRGSVNLGNDARFENTGRTNDVVSGKVTFRYYNNFVGSTIDDFVSSERFPADFDGGVNADACISVRGFGDDYGTRMCALLTPPVTGYYRFWIAGADKTRLLLSTDDTSDNASVIAYSDTPTGLIKWDENSSQMSSPIYLNAGDSYYIEALQVATIDGDVGDHLAVAWMRPWHDTEITHAREIIPGAYLEDIAPPSPTPLPSANTNIWSGATDESWYSSGNWILGRVPYNDLEIDFIQFPDSATRQTVTITNDQRVRGIEWPSYGTVSYLITNNGNDAGIRIGEQGINCNSGGGTCTFGCPVAIPVAQSWTKGWNADAVICQKKVTIDDTLKLDIRSGGTASEKRVIFEDTVYGTGQIDTVNGGWYGGVRFCADNWNTYNGRVNMAGGTVEIASSGALGSGDVRFAAYNGQKPKCLFIVQDGVVLSNDLGLYYAVPGTNHYVGVSMDSGTGVFSGTVILGQETVFYAKPAATAIFPNDISEQSGQTGSVHIHGGGIVGFFGSNTYSGGTYIENGILKVNNTAGSGTGSGAVTVQSHGTLGGTGTISGSVTCNAGGILSPGNSIGTLHVESLTCNAGSLYKWEASTTPACDAIDVASSFTVPAATHSITVQVHGASVLETPQPFITYGSFSGDTNAFYLDFTYADDQTNTNGYFVDDGSGTVSIVIVPEPASVLGSLCITALLARAYLVK